MNSYIRITKPKHSDNPTFLAELARMLGWGLVREYCDVRTQVDSDEYKTLIAESKSGHVDIVCCVEPLRDLSILKEAVQELCSNGTEFYLDTVDSPKSRLIFNLLCAVAEYEKEVDNE